jgi:serine O-acetyltransferase
MKKNGVNTIFGMPDNKLIDEIISDLCKPESYELVYHSAANHDIHMPSILALTSVMDMLKSIIFPGYFSHSEMKPGTMKYYIGSTLDSVYRILSEQIKRGFCFLCEAGDYERRAECEVRSGDISALFLKKLPEIRTLLGKDAQAAYCGDPAAKGIGEVIFSYPSIRALTNHRIAHELYKLDVPLIPRIISEMAHSETGIDIHPGATIAESLFIDHGTGTVIGETCKIGKNVRIYPGVTLGAKSFPLDNEGNPIKGIDRHPKVEDDVIIYSGATILGPVVIGKGAEVGGNVWITDNVPSGARIHQQKPEERFFMNGAGI